MSKKSFGEMSKQTLKEFYKTGNFVDFYINILEDLKIVDEGKKDEKNN